MVAFGSSTYVPLTRRFNNEHAQELNETRQLYAQLRAHGEDVEKTALAIAQNILDLPWLREPLRSDFIHTIVELIDDEAYLEAVQPADLDRMDMHTFVRYRNHLYLKEHYFKNEAEMQGLLVEGIGALLRRVMEAAPELQGPSPFSIPLVYALNDPKNLIDELYTICQQPSCFGNGILRPLTHQLQRNLCDASGRDPEDENSRKPYKFAEGSILPLSEIVDTYLKDTPFHELFMTPVPLKLTQEDRFSHTHIVGGTGSGKTTLIENLILHDIRSDDPPALVLIDPHSDLVRKLFRADLGIEDRVILIDPRDIHFPPAMNPFALNHARLDSYDEATREQVTAGVIQTFSYLFGALFNLDLTGKQSVFFRYSVRLLLSLPVTMGRNATILDMLHLMADDTPYRAAIAKLPDLQRDFFERDFNSATFKPTREQIRYRLQAIIENPTMARLFTATETKVDLFREMNRGAIILVDTAKDFLKDNSAVYGQLIISLVLQAVIERAAIPESRRKPTFLYVDEAASFFSSNIDDLLTEARKFKTGLVLAHQYMDQASASLRASLAANTNIKMASGLSASDARSLAPEMRTTPDFILNQPKLQFATHIRGVTPSAVSIPIERAGELPRLSDADFEHLIARNRERVSLTGGQAAPNDHDPESDYDEGPEIEPDEDISSEW
jgi:Type IV secretion-system coupling protein DNA-binding domain